MTLMGFPNNILPLMIKQGKQKPVKAIGVFISNFTFMARMNIMVILVMYCRLVIKINLDQQPMSYSQQQRPKPQRREATQFQVGADREPSPLQFAVRQYNQNPQRKKKFSFRDIQRLPSVMSITIFQSQILSSQEIPISSTSLARNTLPSTLAQTYAQHPQRVQTKESKAGLIDQLCASLQKMEKAVDQMKDVLGEISSGLQALKKEI